MGFFDWIKGKTRKAFLVAGLLSALGRDLSAAETLIPKEMKDLRRKFDTAIVELQRGKFELEKTTRFLRLVDEILLEARKGGNVSSTSELKAKLTEVISKENTLKKVLPLIISYNNALKEADRLITFIDRDLNNVEINSGGKVYLTKFYEALDLARFNLSLAEKETGSSSKPDGEQIIIRARKILRRIEDARLHEKALTFKTIRDNLRQIILELK